MRDISKVVVLGANGAMGSGAAALFASRGYPVSMLARDLPKAREGLEKALASVRSDVIAQHIQCGSYELDLDREVASADIIIEAVSEDILIKKRFFERVDALRQPGAIVATVSSGLSIAAMTAGRTEDFRRHFMGVHLFNPPTVISGTELIAGPETIGEVLHAVQALLRNRLGRSVVLCRDLPAFAGNRIGFKVLNECAQLAAIHGVERIDYLVGPYTGRAMAPLATVDLVGWDVHKAIVDNVYANTSDEAHASFALPAYMKELLEKGHLGDKSPQGGYYRKAKGTDGVAAKLTLQPRSQTYEPARRTGAVRFVEEVKELHRVGRYRDGLSLFLRAEGEEARLAQKVILGYVSYALHRVGPEEVVDAPHDVDLIMGSGFNWAPPTLLVELFGAKATVAAMESHELAVPRALRTLNEGDSILSREHSNPGRYFAGK